MSFRGRRRRPALLLVAVLVVAACRGGTNGPNDDTPTTEAVGPPGETSTTIGESADPAANAAAVWTHAWTIAAANPTEGLDQHVSDNVAVQLETTLPDSDTYTVTTHPVVVDNGNGTWTINDCLAISPKVTNIESNWYSGTIEDVDGALQLTRLNPESVDGCVPATVAEQARAVAAQWWDLDATGATVGDVEPLLTPDGEYRTSLLDAITATFSSGQVYRALDTHHPEIVLYSTGRVLVTSCSDPSPDTGYYDIATGDRVADSPSAAPGLNLHTLELRIHDGQWRVFAATTSPDVECEQAPTTVALPEV